MSAQLFSENPENWPKMPRVMDEAAKRLHEEYREEGIPSDVLMREVERLGGYGRNSLLPSDYCYNRINRASFSCKHPVLISVPEGRYHYIGPKAAYSGPIFWKPKDGQERQVGHWDNGKCQLDVDPRNVGVIG